MTKLAIFSLLCFAAAPLSVGAEIVGADPQALIEQTGADSKALLGPVIVSEARMMLGGSGEVLALSPIKDLVYAGLSFGKIFHIDSGRPLDVQGNLVCDKSPAYVLVGKSADSDGNMGVRISFFDADQKAALLGDENSQACASSIFKTAEQIADLRLGGNVGAGASEAGDRASGDGADVTSADSGAGSWMVSEKKNPLDDSDTVVLSLAAMNGANTFGESPTLVARCLSNQTEVYIAWKTYLGSGNTTQIVRMGKHPAKHERWSISTDGSAAFSPGWGGNFLQDLEKVDMLTVQITPYGESPITAQFDVTGLSNLLPKIAKTCNWN